VIVVGGSQGAKTLNDAMGGALKTFRPGEVQFIWMTGKSGLEAGRKAAAGVEVSARVTGFIDDMATACAAATLIVSRAGASSTAEIASMGKPSILVPYPHATDNHQETNARAFEAAGAATVILDAECTPERLADEIRGLLSARKRLIAMGEAARSMARPAAVEHIVETILATAFLPETPAP
jgi:UDP-N-acetylglucosamine--N-acetylmuramyl-(pentapeptide) pyrophosphoryl-undecaprenol N-acetylglucosamine transferase